MLDVQVSYVRYLEDKRHNLATEDLTRENLQENKRHNLVTEDQGYISLAETNRHNLVVEQETNRHNVVTENIGWAQASAAQQQAAASLRQADIAQSRYELSRLEYLTSTMPQASANIALTKARTQQTYQDTAMKPIEYVTNTIIGGANAVANLTGSAAKLVDAVIPF